VPEYEAFDLKAYKERVQRNRCFICGIISGQDTTHHILYRDDVAIAFLNKYPTLYGYSLVAPIEHREEVTGDFSPDEYLKLQAVVYRVAEVLRQELPTERVYILSLGSRQGNSHVHWHVAGLPPGVPYDEQQFMALMPFVITSDEMDGLGKQIVTMENRGYLKIPEEELRQLAERLGRRIASMEDSQE
jgi:ATP adenylyltransferase